MLVLVSGDVADDADDAVGDCMYRLRVRRHPVTSQAPATAGYYSGAGHELKLTSYNTTTCSAAAAGGDALTDNDYYKSWRHQISSSTPAGDCYHDDEDRRQYEEHIYESPKFDRRQVSELR